MGKFNHYKYKNWVIDNSGKRIGIQAVETKTFVHPDAKWQMEYTKKATYLRQGRLKYKIYETFENDGSKVMAETTKRATVTCLNATCPKSGKSVEVDTNCFPIPEYKI